MIQHYKTVLILIFSVFLISCKTIDKKQPPQINAIVSIDYGITSINSFPDIFDKTVKLISSDSKVDNFILFVHGRGKHPEKAFEKSLLADLEKNYSSKVLMFHWPSWEGSLAFPVSNARKAAADFNLILKQINDYKISNKDLVNDIKFTLLSNSMGSYVLEESALSNQKYYKNTFDTIVINAAASSAKHHSLWVNTITMSDNVYITINSRDKLLGKVGIKFFEKRLGKGLISLFGSHYTLAKNAKYIDLTKSLLNHSYYLHKDLINRNAARFFYDQVLNGMPAILDIEHGVVETKREHIYILSGIESGK